MPYLIPIRNIADHALHIFHSWGNSTIDPVIRFFRIAKGKSQGVVPFEKNLSCIRICLRRQTIDSLVLKPFSKLF